LPRAASPPRGDRYSLAAERWHRSRGGYGSRTRPRDEYLRRWSLPPSKATPRSVRPTRLVQRASFRTAVLLFAHSDNAR
jgi:hypothetical protein